jgi:hypothetical protein
VLLYCIITAFVNDGCNPLLTMIVITKKMLMMMATFVTWSMCTMTMLAFVNDGCNPLLMMAVIIMKMFFY